MTLKILNKDKQPTLIYFVRGALNLIGFCDQLIGLKGSEILFLKHY